MYPQSPQLVGYIDSQLSDGVAAAYIRQSLLQAGWPLPVIDSSLNDELAHTAHILPTPIDPNAYYSSAAPQYYSGRSATIPSSQWQTSIPTAVTPAEPTDAATDDWPLSWTIAWAVFRFVAASLMVVASIFVPIALALFGLIAVMAVTGSRGFNATAPLLAIWCLAWVVSALVRLAPAPVIAVLHPDIPLSDALDYSYDLIKHVKQEGKGRAALEQDSEE